MVMKKGDKVREIGDTLTGTIVYIANGMLMSNILI